MGHILYILFMLSCYEGPCMTWPAVTQLDERPEFYYFETKEDLTTYLGDFPGHHYWVLDVENNQWLQVVQESNPAYNVVLVPDTSHLLKDAEEILEPEEVFIADDNQIGDGDEMILTVEEEVAPVREREEKLDDQTNR